MLDDQQFLEFFRQVRGVRPDGQPVAYDFGDFAAEFSSPAPHTLFTPEEQHALTEFMASPALPPESTFATFFGRDDVPESKKLLLSAALHVFDRRRSATAQPVRSGGRAQQQREVRATDCGTWVGRVIAYRYGHSIRTRAEFNRRLGSPEHAYQLVGGMPPSVLRGPRFSRGNHKMHDADGRVIHAPVSAEQLGALEPGDWVQYHTQAYAPNSNPRRHVNVNELNNSVLFIGWAGRSRGARARPRRSGMAYVANQVDNDVGGGVIFPVRLSTDETQNAYVYHILSHHPLPEDPPNPPGPRHWWDG